MGWYEGINDAPGGVNATVAQTEAAFAGAMQAAQSGQSDARDFVLQYGADVLGGHSDVGMVSAHNVGADPDEFGPDAADSRG